MYELYVKDNTVLQLAMYIDTISYMWSKHCDNVGNWIKTFHQIYT